MNFLKNIFKKTPSLEDVFLKKINPKPIQNFGPKSIWITVKGDNFKEIISQFEYRKISKVNWEEGISSSSRQSKIFVNGPILNWTLIFGFGLIQPDYKNGMSKVNELIKKLSDNFGEAHYYCSDRNSSSCIWSKALNGKIIRTFAFADEFFYHEGVVSELEKQLDNLNQDPFAQEDDEFWDKNKYPDEDDVFMVAEQWSFNPLKLTQLEGIKKEGYLLEIK